MVDSIENISLLPEIDVDWEVSAPYLFDTIPIVIEYIAGSERKKIHDGIIMSSVMPCAYGYILRTNDIHGEEVDMYLANCPTHGAAIFVIDQICPATGVFDEHKVMLGFSSVEEALETYKSVFSDDSGSSRIGAVTTFTLAAFKTWLGVEGSLLKPASQYAAPDVSISIVNGITKIVKNPSLYKKEIDESGGVVIELPDMSKGPKFFTCVNEKGGIDYTLFLYSALDTKRWSNFVDVFSRTLDLATEKDVVKIKISSPGGSVFLMGRMVSAIERTKATVITYANGCVASAATTIWCSGHIRHILPGAFFMQHMSSQFMSGKTTDIAAISTFCIEYINKHLAKLVKVGLFTDDEISDMVEKSSDIYISGRKAIERVGVVSGKISIIPESIGEKK